MYQPEKLKARRKELKMRQLDLANKLDISIPTVSYWERGVKKPTEDNMRLLEKILEVPKGYFTEIEIVRLYNVLTPNGKEQVVSYARDLVTEEQNKKGISIPEPRYEYRVYEEMSAGLGAAIYGEKEYDTVYYDEELGHDFASWVSGDSMEPKYPHGSVALIRETGFDYDGAVYAVVWNEQTYIKRVYLEKDGLRLVSINKKYKDKFAPYDDDPRIVGKIVGNFMPLQD